VNRTGKTVRVERGGLQVDAIVVDVVAEQQHEDVRRLPRADLAFPLHQVDRGAVRSHPVVAHLARAVGTRLEDGGEACVVADLPSLGERIADERNPAIRRRAGRGQRRIADHPALGVIGDCKTTELARWMLLHELMASRVDVMQVGV